MNECACVCVCVHVYVCVCMRPVWGSCLSVSSFVCLFVVVIICWGWYMVVYVCRVLLDEEVLTIDLSILLFFLLFLFLPLLCVPTVYYMVVCMFRRKEKAGRREAKRGQELFLTYIICV